MIYSFTGIGKRKTNQDFISIDTTNPKKDIFVVADGMGGYDYGDEASTAVAENVTVFLSGVLNVNQQQIQKAVNKANLVIRQKTEDYETKLGATVGGVILENGSAHIFWVGDVKIALIRNYLTVYESQSHTLINDLIKNGNVLYDVKKYKHIVTRSVSGSLKESKIDYNCFDFLLAGDLILIYTDGISDILPSFQLAHLRKTAENFEIFVKAVEDICEKYCTDNYSMLAIEVE